MASMTLYSSSFFLFKNKLPFFFGALLRGAAFFLKTSAR
jgi:hypothetical protein